MSKFLSNLPSIVWVILIPLGFAAIIGGTIGLFFLLANVEGVASIIILLVTIGIIRLSSTPQALPNKPEKSTGFFIALGIVFFALMGMAIDQPGNFIYNKPIEMIFCPKETTLNRGVNVSHPLPERTDITQEFNCVDQKGEIVHRIGMGEVVMVRFVEYVVIGYALIYGSRLIGYIRYLTRRTKIEGPHAPDSVIMKS